jgi:hypothetical protein
MSVARERRRLRAAFGAALVAAGALPVVQACTSSSSPAPPADGGFDSTVADVSADVGADVPSGEDGPAPPTDSGLDRQVPDGNACAVGFVLVDGSAIDAGPDADICDLTLPCGLNAGLTTEGCTVVQADVDGAPIPNSQFGCVVADDAGCYDDVYQPPVNGELGLVCPCAIFISSGRRPRGLVTPSREEAVSTVAGFLARTAYLEAASVEAFRDLARELTRRGAPMELVAAASRAAKDEVRHARVMTRLAADRGGAVPRAVRRRSTGGSRARSLEAILRENAVEGCVRETFGALVAEWQARNAGSAELRGAFARIAADETRHAALAWAVARWGEPRLGATARRRVERARRTAVRKLGGQIALAPPESVAQVAGIPRAPQACALLDHLFGTAAVLRS